MIDPLHEYEKEMHEIDLVYGDGDQIAESLNALVFAMGRFGLTHQQAMVDAINASVPLLAEIEARKAEDDGLLADEYFGDEVSEARTVDAMAEGVKVAQRFLRDWMREHDLEVIAMLVPKLDGSITIFNFGPMKVMAREFPGINDRINHIGATTPLEDD